MFGHHVRVPPAWFRQGLSTVSMLHRFRAMGQWRNRLALPVSLKLLLHLLSNQVHRFIVSFRSNNQTIRELKEELEALNEVLQSLPQDHGQ